MVKRSKFFILLFFFLGFALLSNFSHACQSSQFEQAPKVIISDWHIGTTMWQVAVLKAIGVAVEAYSLSGHRRYAGNDPAFKEDPLFINLGPWSKEKVCEEFAKNCRWSNLAYALCSFPPSYVTALEKLPPQVALFLNIGHRIHIGTAHGLVDFTKRIVEMKRDSRYTVAAMSEYDFHYMRYYTGLEPLRLPVICQHIPQKLRDAAYAPRNRVVLVGPSHASTLIGFEDLETLNRLSVAFAARHGLQPYTFRSIQSLYPNDQATVENLAKHPAVLINPYSAFSISMVELYHLNIPFFVPDDSLLVNKMGDVRLHPLYNKKEEVARLEEAYPVDSSGYPYSPNDEGIEAQRYWLQFMFFNQVKHAQHWTDPEDLFRKLYLNDLRKLHDDMQVENAQLFSEQLKVWATLFGKN